jgi:hypothetical protein
VRGLGVVDALSVEVEPPAVAWLAEAADDLRLEAHGEADAGAARYRAEVLTMISEQLPAGDSPGAEPVTIVGPAAMVRRLVHAAARRSAATLSGALRDADHAADRLREVAAATAALTEALVAIRAIEGYSFDPDYTPLHDDDLE